MNALTAKLPESLVKAFQTHQGIPFVGSGLSLPFGLPTWDKLLEALTERCRKEQKLNPEVILSLKNDGDYLLAAQKAREKLGNYHYKCELENAFKRYEGDPHKGLQGLLWTLRPPMIITTNFDTLLEDAVNPRPEVVTPQHKTKMLDIFRQDNGNILFKMHGSINEIESIVLTEQDYINLYQVDMEAFYLAFIRPILSNTLLFMGFGMTDPGVLGILKRITDLFNSFSGSHYALVKRGEVEVSSFWRDYNVNIIEYDDHSEVFEVISYLCRVANRQTMSSPYTPDESYTPPLASKAKTYITIDPASEIPAHFPDIRRRALGKCIIITGGIRNKQLKTWDEHKILIDTQPTFFRPSPLLEEMQREAQNKFKRLSYANSPRLSLLGVQVEPIINIRHDDMTITSQLTDWALIDGMQTVLERKDSPLYIELMDQFWRSVNSLIGTGEALNFPHHLAVHCLLISRDHKVILNKRAGVSNQRGRISASFEEQMQVAHIYPASEKRHQRYFDGDGDPVTAVIRGANEELGIELERGNISILALCMEASSIAANLLAIAKSSLTANEIFDRWRKAEDRGENQMIRPENLPEWSIEGVLPILGSQSEQDTEHLYGGMWHASSPARLVLGLIHDFGVEAVEGHISLAPFYD